MSWRDMKTRQTRRPRRLEEVDQAELGLPIVWVVIGAVAGLLVIGLVTLGVVNIVRQQSITPTPETIPGVAPTQPIADAPSGTEEAASGTAATPTIPPVVTLPPTPTSPPTATPVPTVPLELTPSTFAQVTGTEGAGVSLRAGPGTNNARLGIAGEASFVLILDGPREDENLEDFTWWLVRGADGTEGWTVQEYLIPSLPPDNPEQFEAPADTGEGDTAEEGATTQ